MAALARGLSEFGEGFDTLVGTLAEGRKEDLREEGKMRMQEAIENQKTYADLVREGEIDGTENPWFLLGLQSTAGSNAAANFQADFIAKKGIRTEDPDSDGRGRFRLTNATTLEEFNQELASHVEDYVQRKVGEANRTEAFDLAFRTSLEGVKTSLRNEYARQRPDILNEEMDDQLETRMQNVIRDNLDRGVGMDQIGSDLTTILREHYDLNPDRARRNKGVLINAVRSLAVETEDLTIFQALEHVMEGPPGEGTPLSEGSLDEQINDAFIQAGDILRQKDNARKNAKQARAQTVLVEGSQEALDRLLEDPTADVSDIAQRMSEAGIPDAAAQVTRIQNNARKLGVHTDPEVFDAHVTNIWDDGNLPSETDILRDVGRGLSGQQARILIGDIQSRKRSNTQGSTEYDLLRNPVFTKAQSRVSDFFRSLDAPIAAGLAPSGNLRPFIGATERRLEGRFLRLMTRGRGREMSADELSEWLEAQTLDIASDLAEGEAFEVQSGQDVQANDTGESAGFPEASTDALDPLRDPVVTRSQALSLQGALDAGQMTPEAANIMDEYGLTETEDQMRFIRIQLQFLNAPSDNDGN